jgi:hypothetical protein
MSAKTKNKIGFNEVLLLGVLAVGITWSMSPPIMREVYYSNAKAMATQIYGDHKVPLTTGEMQEWYRDMGVPTEGRPNGSQLLDFMRTHKIR